MTKTDFRSEESAQYRGLYKSSRWTKARARFLHHNPLCVFCGEEGIAKAANVVDHKKPHKGDLKLFWDENNWQALCFHHHNSAKQKMERNTAVEVGLDGWPIEF